MFSKFAKKIELKFWDVMIPLLSNSVWLQKTIQKISSLYHDEDFIKHAATAVVIACAGFASGFLFFSLSAIFS